MRLRDWLPAAASVAAVAVAVLVIGGVLRWTQALVAVLVAVGVAGTLFSRRGLAKLSPLVGLIATATVLTALQLLPLPLALREALSPTSTALRTDGASLVGVDESSALTNDVPATLGALVFFLTLLGLAIIGLRYSTTERGRYRSTAFVALVCGAVAIVVAVHRLFGLRSLYGIYEPSYASPVILAPLLNGNTLGCLMALGVMLGIGLAAYQRQRGWLRALWLVLVAGCGAITVSTVSRGATLALAAGAFVTMAIIIGQRVTGTEAGRRRRGRFITHALPIGVVAGCMIVLIIWMNAGNVERQLSQLSFDEVHHSRSKFAAWRSSQQLVEDAPWLGIGRGSFESTFTRVHPPSGMATYSHLENEYLQTVVDWGIPAAMILGFFAIWLAFVGLRRWRDGPLTAGALGAVAVVAIQSNVDFGLELLGLAAPMTLVAATLSYVPMREIQAVRRVRALRVAHAVGLLIGSVLLMTSYTTTLDEDHRALARRPTLENARAAIVRHPLDYYSYAVAAELSDRRRDPRAIRLLNHAMILHPTHPDLHRAAGRMLFRDGFVDQATIEYATALRASHDPPKLVREILAKFPPEKAPLAFPTDYPEPGLLVRQMMDAGHADIATAWLERVLALGFKSAKSCEQLYILADQGSHEAADIAARRCIALLPDYQARLRLASMLARANKHDLILGLLEDIDTWQSRVDDKITAWLVLCDAHAALGRVDEAKRCLRRLDASPDMRRERSPEVIQRLEELKSAATGSAATP